MPRFAPVLLAFASFLMVSGARAEDALAPLDPPELIALRQEFQRSLQQANLPIIADFGFKLDALKVSRVRDGSLDGAFEADRELKRVTLQWETAKDIADGTVKMPLTILSAIYVGKNKAHPIDITADLRKALNEGKPGFKLDNGHAGHGKDPAPDVPKQTIIIYAFDAEHREKIFAEAHELNFAQDLR